MSLISKAFAPGIIFDRDSLRSRPPATTVEELRRPESGQKINFTPSWSCRGGEMMSVGLPNAGPALNVPI